MKQPEALRLADWLDKLDVRTPDKIQNCVSASAELRRLHEAEEHNRTYVAVLEKEVTRLHEVNQAMLDALTWIADQTYDPWTNGYEAQRVAAAAIDKATGE